MSHIKQLTRPTYYQPCPSPAPDAYGPGQVVTADVVGVTYDGRQALIALLWPGERVWLKREPDNRFDRNAVAVQRQSGRPIGYLSRELALELAPRFDRYGLPVVAVITLLTGSYPRRGVSIRFVVPSDG